MAVEQQKRKTVLTDMRFQIGLAAKLGLLNLLGIIFLTLAFIILTQDYVSSLDITSEISFLSTYKDFILNNIPIIVAYIFIIVFFIFLHSILSIRLTHKLTGPVFRIDRKINQIRSGDLSRNFELRANDNGKKLAESVEGLRYDFETRIGDISQDVEELNDLTKDVNAFLKKDTATELNHFHSRTAILKQKLNFFQIRNGNQIT